MLGALDDVTIEGVRTNLEFLKRCLDHAEFRAGRVSTGFVDAHLPDLINS
jgi:pyruvate carboxylase